MKIDLPLLLLAPFSLLVCLNLRAAEPKPPVAEKKPVFNEYHGAKVEDDYQWLENDDDAAVKAWSEAENKRTRAYLDSLPSRNKIEEQLKAWYAKTSPSYSSIATRPGLLFALKTQPPKQQPMLVTLVSANDLKSEKVLLDPNQIDSKGTTTIDWFEPSLDGRKVAVSISKGGSEDGTLHFYDARTGKELGDTIAHVQYPTAGGRPRGTPMGAAFITRAFPRGASERRRTLISISRFISTNSARQIARTLMRSAKIFPGSPRSSWSHRMMASISWPRSQMVTAATSPITC